MTPEEFNQKAAELVGWNVIGPFKPWAYDSHAIQMLRDAANQSGLSIQCCIRSEPAFGKSLDDAKTAASGIENWVPTFDPDDVTFVAEIDVAHEHGTTQVVWRDKTVTETACRAMAAAMNWGTIDEPAD